MKKYHLLTAILLLSLVSCTQDERSPGFNSLSDSESLKEERLLKEKPVFHKGTETFIVHQNDPYTLENFKTALQKLSSGQSQQSLTKAQADCFSSSQELSATHYALKIYPRNESEQWQIELMEGIKVSYIPFDYVQLPEDEQKRLKQDYGSSLQQSSTLETSPYTVTYDDLMTTDGPVPPETYTMPILYTVWPCDKPLPEAYDYIIDYEVFIPQYNDGTKSQSGLSTDALHILEQEAISIALGKPVNNEATTKSSSVVRTLTKILYCHDNLMKNLPVANLKIQFKLGSNIWETYTQSNGYFSITNAIPLEATYSQIFQHPRWKITMENSTSPISYTLGTVQDAWHNNTDKTFTTYSYAEFPVYEILRAVNYYYNGNHSIRTWHYDEGIRIRALTTENQYNGYFSYFTNKPAYISIYANNEQKRHWRIGTVLHELGHFTQYGERGGATEFNQVHRLIQESYASYVGYYLGESYYESQGYTKTSINENVTGQGRQGWVSPATYSPLFVDLIDDYNQNEYYPSLSYDPIKNFPHSIIRTMAATCPDKNSIFSKLQEYVGIYYTSSELTKFLEPYNNAF